MALDIGILFTPIGLLAIAVVIAILGVIAYLLISRKPIKEVLLLRPRDKRGLVVPIAQESDLGITCKKTGGIVRRFLKAGCAWTFTIRGKVVTRFFGIEGTAYTAVMKSKDVAQVKLAEALRFIWGDDFYDKIPDEQREAIEIHEWGLTIEAVPIEEEKEGLIPISSDDIHDAADSVVLDKLAEGVKTSTKMEVYQFAMGAIAGAFLAYLAVHMGWIR